MLAIIKKRIVGIVKKIVIATVLLSLCQTASAQGLINTMLAQIAKIEIYLQEVKQGYSYVQKGLTTISNIKKGDFDLHSLFFSSLKDVNPQIRSLAEVADLAAMQIDIINTCRKGVGQSVSSSFLSKDEQTYLNDVFSSVEDLTTKDIDELTGLLSDGDWSMSDDERMARIDALYKRVEEKYTFVRSFSDNISLNQKQHQSESSSLSNLLKLTQP